MKNCMKNGAWRTGVMSDRIFDFVPTALAGDSYFCWLWVAEGSVKAPHDTTNAGGGSG